MNVESKIKVVDGIPRLEINGRITDGMASMTYYTDKSCHADFAARGYRLFSLPVFFGDLTINENTHIPPFKKGIFTEETPDFTELDRDALDIIAARADAYIFPRIDVSLPSRWLEANPDELCDTGTANFPNSRRECFSSDKWACEVKRLLTLLVEHVESSPYRDNIVGYQISGGLTQEWMAFDINGSQGRRSREKFAEYCEKNKLDGCESEYYAFLSHMTAQRICEFAEHVKSLIEHRLLVGAFYGYTMELADRAFTHHALGEVLASPYIDFLCSPISYANFRKAGHDHAYMLPIDSVKLHGKLYFSENDTRTHLTLPPNEIPAYNTPIWYGPNSEQSKNILKMHFARALTHAHALWWFDMWGGWYACEEYMSLLEKMRDISEESIDMPLASISEIAVFIDENAVFSADPTVYRHVCYDIRDVLGCSGAPYDIYLASDYLKVADKYRAAVVLSPSETALESEICRYLDDIQTPVLKITLENADISTKELRKFLIDAGVCLFCDRDAVVYANESYIFVHTAEKGLYNIKTSHGVALIDAFTGDSVSGEINCSLGESFLFKKVRKI